MQVALKCICQYMPFNLLCVRSLPTLAEIIGVPYCTFLRENIHYTVLAIIAKDIQWYGPGKMDHGIEGSHRSILCMML